MSTDRDPAIKLHTARLVRRLLPIAFVVAALAALASASSAQALVSDPWANPSFNTGNLTAWQSSGQVVANAAGNPQSAVSPVNVYAPNFRTPDPGRVFGYKPPTWLDTTVGSHYALVLSGCNGTTDLDPPGTSTLSRDFEVAHAGDVLSGYSFFKSNDYYNDSGTVQILDSDGDVVHVVFHSDQATVGTYQGTPWVGWSHTFTEPGSYTLQVESTSGIDCEAPSAVGLDLPTPNPLKMGQTIDYPPPSKVYGDVNFDLGATATSGKPVSYSSTTPSVCTIVAGQVHIVGAGNCSITASVAGDQDYAPKTRTIAFAIAKAQLSVNADDQTRQFGGVDPGLTYGVTGFVNGETGSSANVTGDAACSLDPGAGPDAGAYANAITCVPGTLSAANYDFQTGSPGKLTITQADQTIDMPAPADMSVLDDDFYPDATATSGLPVSYSSSTPGVCTIVDGQVHIVGAGECDVTASQAGDGNYHAAQDVTRTFSVSKVDQAIDFADPADVTYGHADFDPGATATSGLPVGYSSSTPGVCTIVDGEVHIVGAGDCTVITSQSGNGTYTSAENVVRTFAVAKAPQTIDFASPSDKSTVDPDFDPGAAASSGLPVAYSSSTPSVCTVVDGKVRMVGAGTCTITASQPGNGDYAAALDATRSFAVTKPTEPPTMSITTPADGATYYQYQAIKADYSCQAAPGVNLASCTGTVSVGGPIDTSTPGAHSFKVTATDTADNEAQKTVTYNVIPVGTSSGGAFVIGDRNAGIGSQVTFWGSKWSKQNSLSGGSAPPSFKGFADSASSNPLAWGGWWTTRPGNSSKPPDSIPSYMAVIVAANVEQSKSTIGGDNPQVVVVKTDPGYDSNPGHPGTGTVVAKLG
jgi:hypothetical protein